jgi:hypothetical protein
VLRAAFPDLQFAIKRAPESGSMREEFVGPSMSGVSRADFQWHMVALVLSWKVHTKGISWVFLQPARK